MSFRICETCAVEHVEDADFCAICADDRQFVPATGQKWTTLLDLAERGFHARISELEPDLFGISTTPELGIGQTSKLIRTDAGSVLFDPIGFLDDTTVARVRELGPVAAIVASHPHMYGVQVEWSRRLDGALVLVAEKDAAWVARPDPCIRTWSGDLEIVPGVTLTQPGGHFPGSTVAHWALGAEGRGVLLSGDTLYANPDRSSVSFMRSYPNYLPLSANVARRIAAHVGRFRFDRLYGNFDDVVPEDAADIVQQSAERHARWVSGEFDDLT